MTCRIKGLTVIFILIIYSCSIDKQLEAPKIYTFKKVKSKSDANKNYIYEDVDILVKSFDPLIIESSEMEVQTAISAVTYNQLEIISFIESEHSNYTKQPTQKSGWLYYSKTDCFIYGTYTYYENGKVTFTFASKATQILMNSCGDNDGEPYTQTGFAFLIK